MQSQEKLNIYIEKTKQKYKLEAPWLQNTIIFILVLLLLLAGWGLKNSSSYQDNSIIEYSLNNDLDVLLKPGASPLISVQAWVRVGTVNERDNSNGLAHFVEHMLFKKRELVQEIEQRGGLFNAATSYDFTYYYITIPREEACFAIRVLGELVFNNSFNEVDFQKERQVILEEIALAEDNPLSVIYDFVSAKVYGSHPYGQRILGTQDKIANYSLADLTSFYKKYYVPNNVTLVLAGGMNKKEIKRDIRYLQKYPKATVPAQIIRDDLRLRQAFNKQIPKLASPYFLYVYSVPGVTSYDSHVLDVLAYLLGNRPNALLNKKLQEELGLTYDISVSYQTRKNRSIFMVQIPLRSLDNLDRVKREYKQLLANMNIADWELALVKADIKKYFSLQQEDISEVAFGLGYYNTLDTYKYQRDYLVNINKVSLNDIRQVWTKYFEDNDQFIFVGANK